MFIYFQAPEHGHDLHGIAEKMGEAHPDVLGYRAFLEFAHLEEPLKIYYPAAGDDVSAAKAFPHSEIWHVDPGNTTATLEKALSSPQHHLVKASAWEFTPPEPVDVVLLRDAAIPDENGFAVEKVTEMLRVSGFVICSEWAGAHQAENLAQNPDFKLVGFIEPVDPAQPHGEYRVNTNVSRIEDDLRAEKKGRGEIGSVHAGKIFVFRKIDEDLLVAPTPSRQVEGVQKTVWGKIRSFFKGMWESVME